MRHDLNNAQHPCGAGGAIAGIAAGIAAGPGSPALDEAWFKRARPAAQVLPPDVYAGLVAMRRRLGERGPQKAPTKLRVSLRLSRDVAHTCRATGDGWQTHVPDALREVVAKHRYSSHARAAQRQRVFIYSYRRQSAGVVRCR